VFFALFRPDLQDVENGFRPFLLTFLALVNLHLLHKAQDGWIPYMLFREMFQADVTMRREVDLPVPTSPVMTLRAPRSRA